jgi:beta-lactamase class A
MTMRQPGRWPWYALAISALLISGSAVTTAPANTAALVSAPSPASTTAPASNPASVAAPVSPPSTPSPSSTPSPASTPPAAQAAAAPRICSSPSQPALAATLSRRIARALRGTEATVGIAVEDSDEDFRCRYHQWQEFHSASVIKVITLGALLYQLQQEHESLGPDQDTLATAMITESDNDAQDTLWNEVGMPALQAFLNAAGMNHTVLGTDDFWGLTEVNAHDELRLLRLLITHNNVLDAASRHYALTLMADVISWQRWGVSAGAPADMTVHLKNGWLPDPDLWDINSIGDFTYHDLDYSIAILTRNDPDMAYGVDTVQAIASLINKALAEGDTDAVAAPEPFHHLLYMQRRFLG